MFSPPGYTAIRTIRDECESHHDDRIGRRWQRVVWLHNQIHSAPKIYGASSDGRVMTLSKQVLSVLNEFHAYEYAFIDAVTWTVSLDEFRRAGLSGDDLETGMHILGDSFVSRPDYQIARKLLPFEGWYLALEDDDAEHIIDQLDEPAPIEKRSLPPEGSGRKAFYEFVRSFPDRLPKEREWNEWASNNLQGKRTSGRMLWREIKLIRLVELAEKQDDSE